MKGQGQKFEASLFQPALPSGRLPTSDFGLRTLKNIFLEAESDMH